MKPCRGCGQPPNWCDCPTVLGHKVRIDERMGRDQVALVNDDGRGVSIQDGEVTPFIMPTEEPER